MLVVTAHNVTYPGLNRHLERPDGTADYEVWIGIGHRCIWQGTIKGHKRKEGAAALLRLIADRMDGFVCSIDAENMTKVAKIKGKNDGRK